MKVVPPQASSPSHRSAATSAQSNPDSEHLPTPVGVGDGVTTPAGDGVTTAMGLGVVGGASRGITGVVGDFVVGESVGGVTMLRFVGAGVG